MKQKTTGYLQIFAAVLIWAISSGIMVRWIDQGAEIIYGVGAIAGFAFILVWTILSGKIQEIKKTFEHRKNLALIGLFIGINNGLFYLAIKYTTIANASLTHYLAPTLLALIFAPIILKQKIEKIHIVASLLGFAGLLIMLFPQIKVVEINVGVLLGLGSAIFFAWHTAIEGKLATQTKIDPLVEVLYKNGVPALMFMPFILTKMMLNGINIQDFGKLIFFGVLVLGISFVLLFKGLSKVSAQNASVMFYGEPVGAIILAWIFWNEQISIFTIVGGTLILLAGYLAVKK